ncbi:MAG: aminotransferase class I/II-fold pyridoxal phosphate-dependent enzyme [Bacteroidia bacterium]|nr:aminotransferase class I/II-fold pyridoxal phosphate-dependent enzyme [Bacteroidia bacterium]
MLLGNGSDEVLGFAFMAYADETRSATIPDVSYGFYRVYAQLYRVTPTVVPLNEDFSLPVEKFLNQRQLVALANPNAPTSVALPLSEVERIVAGNPGSIGKRSLPDVFHPDIIFYIFARSGQPVGQFLQFTAG